MPEHTRPARGMRDFLPEDVRRRDYVIGIVKDVYRRYGFEPLETPSLENIETLTGKYGEEGNKLIFKVLRRGEHEASGEADLALRYDLTVPLARVVAEYRGKLPRHFKRYQIQPVWRADRPARGRFREFYQCDVDAIGSTSAVVEVELCSAVCEVLQRLGFSDFQLLLNHRGLLSGLLDACGVPAHQHGDALISLDKLDKIGHDGVVTDLVARGVDETVARRFSDSFVRDRGDDGQLDELAKRFEGHEAGLQAVRNLQQILRLSKSTPAANHMSLALPLARGLSYYTGAIMEIRVADLAGSLGGGGRYDGLIGMFLGENIPACGFSLGLERTLVVMGERGMFPASAADSAPADVMLTLFDEEGVPDALRLGGELRARGVRVEIYPEPSKLGKQFKYTSERRIRFAVVAGSDERARHEVTIKNMETGEQSSVPRASAADWLAARAGEQPASPA
jgi:histidyl-tRNA synthetase